MVSAIRDLQGIQRRPSASDGGVREEPVKAPAPVRQPFPWRKAMRNTFWAVGFLACGIGAWQLWHFVRQPSLMPISSIRIEGLSPHIPVYRVNRAIAPFLGQGFLWVNLRDLRHALHTLPWVANADVRRVWPDRLEIDLQSVHPMARWLGGAGQILGQDGKVYSVPPSDVPQQLPALFGPAEDGLQMLQERQKLDQALAPLGLQVRALELDQRGGWRCILSNGVRLVLGRQEVMADVQRWVAVAPEIQQYLVPGASMDLRYNNGFAVALPEAASTSVSEGPAAPRSERK